LAYKRNPCNAINSISHRTMLCPQSTKHDQYIHGSRQLASFIVHVMLISEFETTTLIVF